MSKVFKRGEKVSAEVNLTPMIDITFQLIIFFILTSNMAITENVEMIVPEPEQSVARPLGEVERVVVNVVPQTYGSGERGGKGESNAYAFDGFPSKVTIGQQEFPGSPAENMTKIMESLAAEYARNPEIEVLLRADGALYYDQVQLVMGAIAGAQIKTVKLVAYVDDEQQ